MWNILSTNKSFFIPYILFLIAGGILLLIYTRVGLFILVNDLNHPFADQFFTYFTHIGDGFFYVAIILLLLFYRYKYAIMGFTCFALTGLLSRFLKKIVFPEVLRPYKFFEASDLKLHFLEGVNLHSFYSFPSGHSTTAFSVFCFLAIIINNKWYDFLFFYWLYWVLIPGCMLASIFLTIFILDH